MTTALLLAGCGVAVLSVALLIVRGSRRPYEDLPGDHDFYWPQ